MENIRSGSIGLMSVIHTLQPLIRDGTKAEMILSANEREEANSGAALAAQHAAVSLGRGRTTRLIYDGLAKTNCHCGN